MPIEENLYEWDSLWINAHIATMNNADYGELLHAAIAVKNGVIVWLGTMHELPHTYTCSHVYDVSGAWIVPSLIDCHTHIIYASNRSHEFEMRLNGMSYETIAQQGGGIASSVRMLRQVSEEELYAQTLPRLQAAMSEGVSTLEIKSGYGLDLANERKMLRVAKWIEDTLPIRLQKTFLGAHALPPEYQAQGEKGAERYIDVICQEIMPQLAEEKLIDAVDVFCEKIGFTYAQTEKVFQAAQQLGLKIKCHAEQLSDMNATALTAQYGGLSADHLEYLSETGIAAMKKARMVAVLLPAAFYFLRETKLPPIASLRAAGVPIAIATDCNPGTSPITSPIMTMNMACTLFRLSPQEALAGFTRHAAQALGLAHQIGHLAIGLQADFGVWHIARPADLSYHMGGLRCAYRVLSGKIEANLSLYSATPTPRKEVLVQSF